MFLKCKIKLRFIILIGISFIILLTIFLLGIYSVKTVKELGENLVQVNKSFLQTEFADMITNTTSGNASSFSATFKETEDLTFLFAEEAAFLINRKDIKYNPRQCPIAEFKDYKDQKIQVYVPKKPPLITVTYYGPDKKIPKESYEALLRLMPIRFKLTDKIKKVMPIISLVGIDIGKYGFAISSGDVSKDLLEIPKSQNTDFYEYGKYEVEYLNKENNGKFKNITSTKQCFWTNPYKNSIKGKPSVGVRVPIFDSSGKIIGLVGIDIEIDSLIQLSLQKSFIEENMPNNYKLNRHKYSMLITDDTAFVYVSDNSLCNLLSVPEITDENYPFYLEYKSKMPKLINSSNPIIRQIAEKIKKTNIGLDFFSVDGNKYILSYCRIKTNNWIFINLIPYSDITSIINTTENSTKASIDVLIYRFTIISIICFLISLTLSILFFNFFLHKPIIKLCNAVKKIRDGNFDFKIEKKGIAELQDLADSYNSLGSSLKKYIQDFEKEVKKSQHYETEISIAAQVQQAVLPIVKDKYIRSDFQLGAKLIPAKFIAGDFYDFFFITDDEIALVIADVSGKGISAAFFMANAKAIIKGICQFCKHPNEILDKTNKILAKNNDSRLFATVFLGIYNLKNNMFRFANAGHNNAILISKEGKLSEFGHLGDPPVGFFDIVNYKSKNIKIETGDTVVLYTDGITEAVDKSTKKFYGEEKLHSLLRENHNLNSGNLVNIVTDSTVEFQHHDLFDDITILTVKRMR